ncbi:glycosyltransferase family 2 protein [Flavobacterium hercynium]|uniref:glycosyltransferase family 2 protein n=1 Tax=Flavobacterium hercynium TaxID=387094 RepID=UPI000B5B69C0|nr:glycosyltransferase family 2 protein [Flavobacterium hercynium]SMP28193.1 Glycosyltransferase involved in cell wall bisynthesis [Flavobacterium hercynium]
MNKIPISVIVSVKNEALNLPSCLDKLKRFTQIIVVDSGSTDETVTIASGMGAEVLQFQWNGKFPKKRNWAMQNAKILNEWILFLDADEFVTDEFIDEIAFKTQDDSYSGFTIQFENYFMGKKMRYGYGFKKSALFKKSKGAYEKVEEDLWSHLDMEVHEHPIIEGKVGVIKSKVVHKDFKNLEHYIAKHNAYSTWEAQRYLQLKQTKNAFLSVNQKIKYGLLNTGLLPAVYFLGVYFLKLGFLDGKQGFYLARFKSHYFFQIQTKVDSFKNNIELK